MPHLETLFSHVAQIIKVSGRLITPEHVREADALICRSITRVDKALLKKSSVQFVGTATIGTDHLQLEWLQQQGIGWSNAAGCNAAAVAQYVISGICYWLKHKNNSTEISSAGLVVGIIGAGNVGSELARCLQCLGIEYRLYDPPLERQGDPRHFVSMDEILKCDVISAHVPITREGTDATFHLIDSAFLQRLIPEQLVINAARGEVIDNLALLDYLQNETCADFILDVFENEPAINYQLAERCLVATPHIAGHTLEGKSRGSYMVYQSFCEYFQLDKRVSSDNLFPDRNEFIPENIKVTGSDENTRSLNEVDSLLAIYDIGDDYARLLDCDSTGIEQHFDELRKAYVSAYQTYQGYPRRDYSGWSQSAYFHSLVNQLLN